MQFTKHALDRSKQRGISKDIIELMLLLGEGHSKPGGAIELTVKKKDISILLDQIKRLHKLLQKLPNKAALMKDDTIITIYHKTKKQRR